MPVCRIDGRPAHRALASGAGPSTLVARETFYLQTSPELHMKRLLVRIRFDLPGGFGISPAGERGPWHHPEFTMAEWLWPWERHSRRE